MAEKASLLFPIICIVISFLLVTYLHRRSLSQLLQCTWRCIQDLQPSSTHQLYQWARRFYPSHDHAVDHIRCETRLSGMTFPSDVRQCDLQQKSPERGQVPLESKSGFYESYEADMSSSSLGSVSILSLDSGSEDRGQDPFSSASDPRVSSPHCPSWRFDVYGREIVDVFPRLPPLPAWERDLQQRILHGIGPGAWLDRLVDWIVQRILDAEEKHGDAGVKPNSP
ncbi:hypothetical protein N7462_003287 [Penicillium macrosclerotiorum]|uniref:uncharacterized protein n=1 Tax=Penicillium macrosclerotiorum TaxID=303699 RepID=UPI0025467441|nr:uncharacterized protein N7462_003287 [Penicillium macrosclerotiorum]KAJ5688895.1 hypothetical protein N7462_003287 [Penicillium macrosclerotiorum]